jgi:8-oxo-dGTP pyrophosphatase MutT (NUDIX family)
MEEVDTLVPPMFEPSGEVMTATDAIVTGKWLGSGNVWVYRHRNNKIEFLYQEREPNSPWMPGKLDVAAGGYFKKGESSTPEARRYGALRELNEELGINVGPERLQYITRRLNVGISQKGNERKSCCSIYSLELHESDQINIDGQEVVAIYWIPLDDLLAMHKSPDHIIVSNRQDKDTTTEKPISSLDFCPNYDDYLFNMPATISALIKA